MTAEERDRIEAKLDQVLEQLETIHRFLEPIAHWMRNVGQTVAPLTGAVAGAPAATEYLESRRPGKRESIPEPKTDPGYKNGE
jgi:hypothetical protein